MKKELITVFIIILMKYLNCFVHFEDYNTWKSCNKTKNKYPSPHRLQVYTDIQIINSVSIKKCCLSNEILNVSGKSLSCEAAPLEKIWKPILYAKPEEKLGDERKIYFKTVGLPNCEWTVLDNRVDTWFNILEDGNVSVGLNFWTIPLWLHPMDSPRSGYCLDAMSISNNSDIEHERNSVLVFCKLENFQLYLAVRTGFGVVFIISAFSLFVAIIIYLLIWKTLNIHGWTQFSFLLSVFFFYLSEGSRIFVKRNGLTINPSKWCFAHAITAHYFTAVLSGTSCMMSLDCFITFWKLRTVRSKTKRELLIYLLLAWGIPLLALVVGLYLHFMNNPEKVEHEASGVFEYAHYRCSSPIWEFVFRVQLLLIIVNFLAFIGTTCLIINHWKSTAMATANRHKSNETWIKFKKSINLFLKLFLITGIIWTLSAIDLIVGYKDPLGWIFITFRMCSSLQGVIYLLFFGLHKKNFVHLRRKYPCLGESHVLLWIFKSTAERPRSNTGGSRSQLQSRPATS